MKRTNWIGGIALEKHHIIFKSQGGLDFELNYKYLNPKEHRGNSGPHLNKKTDLSYKKDLQGKLENILTDDYYNIKELIEIFGLKERQANRAFRKLMKADGIKKEDVIRRLMGGRIYI